MKNNDLVSAIFFVAILLMSLCATILFFNHRFSEAAPYGIIVLSMLSVERIASAIESRK